MTARRTRPWLLAAAGLAGLVAGGMALEVYSVSSITRLLILAGLAASWNIVGGLAGQLHLGHAVFFGLGAYAAGWSMLHIADAPVVAVMLAMVVTASASVVLMPLFRAEHAYFAIGTLAIVVVLGEIAGRYFPGGNSGFSFPSRPSAYEATTILLVATALVATCVVAWSLRRGGFGLSLTALKNNGLAAQLAGVNVFAAKASTFALSGALGGGFGALYSIDLGYLDPDSAFLIEWSILPILATLIGGIGTVTGPLIGALVVWELDEVLRTSVDSPAATLLVQGLLFLAIARWAPRGIVGALIPRPAPRPPRALARLVEPASRRPEKAKA
jgi:branched-chain amino acid transport system permease protein